MECLRLESYILFRIFLLQSSTLIIFDLNGGVFAATHILFHTLLELRHVLELDFKRSKHWASIKGQCCPLTWAHIRQFRVFLWGIDHCLRSVSVHLMIARYFTESVKALYMYQVSLAFTVLALNVRHNASLAIVVSERAQTRSLKLPHRFSLHLKHDISLPVSLSIS